MAGDELKVSVKFDAAKAVKQIDQLSKKAKDAGESFDDLEVNAKNVARVMEAQADSMIADMKASEKAAEALAAALGPEMAAKIGNARIDELIADVRRAGIEMDDLTANANEFANVLRKVDSAGDSVKDLDRAMARVGETTDNTRSVVANFAGNAAQELPGVSQALGPLNMAIGQFAEYASEGNIQLDKFITAGVGLAGAAGVMALIAKESEHIAKINAFKSESVDNYTEALKDTKKGVDAVRSALEKAQKVEFVLGDNDPTWGVHGISVLADMTKLLNLVGVNADQAARLIDGGKDDIEAWGAALINSGADAALVQAAMDGLNQQVDFYSQAVDNAAASTQFFSAKTTEASTASIHLGDANKETAQQTWIMEDAANDAAAASANLRDRVSEARDRLSDLQDQISGDAALVNLKTQLRDNASRIDTLRENFEDGKISAEDYFLGVASASLDSKGAVADYFAELETVDDTIATDIVVNLDPSSPEVIFTKLDTALGKKRLHMGVDTFYTSPDLKKLMEGGIVVSPGKIKVGVQGDVGYQRNAAGTSSSSGGLTLVGEQGPELVNMPKGAEVLSAGRTQAALRGGSAGGDTYNIVIQPRTMPTERELIDLVNGIRRKQGPVI